MGRLDGRTAGPDCGLAGTLLPFSDFLLYSGSLMPAAPPPLTLGPAAKHMLEPGGGEPARSYVLGIKTGGFVPFVLNKKTVGSSWLAGSVSYKKTGHVLNKKTAAGFVGIEAQVQFLY